MATFSGGGDLEHIENAISTLYEDLYDSKTKSEYSLCYSTANLSNFDYKFIYKTSTFSGWWSCCGKPQNFNRVRFPITVREGSPISSIVVKIGKLPEKNNISFSTYGVTPTPMNWDTLCSVEITFDEPLSEPGITYVNANLPSIIKNESGDYLFIGILCSAYATLGVVTNTYSDIPYNPWYYYATEGKQQNQSTAVVSGTYDSNSTTILTLPCEFYFLSSEESYIEIGSEKQDKFFNLVNNCIVNSDALSNIFEESYKRSYLVGSQDLTSAKGNTTTNIPTTSTFTGVCFPIGIIPSNLEVNGCCLKIKARSYNEDSTPITKVWAYLYSVDTIPYDSSTLTWDQLGASLLRTGVAECNIPSEEEDVVYIEWDEEPFTNTEGKFLMLGYNCNSYNYRCFASPSKSGAAVCGSIDGKTYNALDTYYSVQKEKKQTWARHWTDSVSNAWCLVSSTKQFTFGEKFDGLLEEAISNTSVNVSTSEVRLAKQYDLVVGDTFQLYYAGVVKAFDYSKEGITVRCAKGKEYPRYWEYTPAAGEEGTYTLTLYTRQLDGSIISQGSTKIVVHSKLTNNTTPENINILCFGDSLTSGGQWCGEGLRRIYGSSSGTASPASDGVTNTVTTYGNKSTSIQGFKVYHEGYGGWTWDTFLSTSRDASSTTNGIIVTLSAAHGYDLNTVQKSIWIDNNGLLWELEDFPATNKIKFNRGSGNTGTQTNTTLPTTLKCSSPVLSITPASTVWESGNPFYNEDTESIDFADHALQFGVSSADIVACLLTWNGGGGDLNFNNETKVGAHIKKATELLRIIHNDFPKAKIIVMGVQISSLTGGTGYNYGANGTYADRMGTAFYAFDYDKALEELVTNSEFGQYCYYADTKGQFDTYYNMPYKMVAVNTRNSTLTEMQGTNGVHPSTEGYYQIGDVFYRSLTKVIPTFVS